MPIMISNSRTPPPSQRSTGRKMEEETTVERRKGKGKFVKQDMEVEVEEKKL